MEHGKEQKKRSRLWTFLAIGIIVAFFAYIFLVPIHRSTTVESPDGNWNAGLSMKLTSGLPFSDEPGLVSVSLVSKSGNGQTHLAFDPSQRMHWPPEIKWQSDSSAVDFVVNGKKMMTLYPAAFSSLSSRVANSGD